MLATALHSPPLQFPILLQGFARAKHPARAPQIKAIVASFDNDEEIVGDGDAAESYFRVIAGLFRAVKFTPDGRRQVFAFYGPGDLIGLDAHDVHEATIEAVTTGSLLVFSRNSLPAAMAADASLAFLLFRGAADALARTISHMTMIGRSSAIERMAWFLIETAGHLDDRSANNQQCTLAMSRRDIADYLGLTIETISRSLKTLKQREIITLRTSRLVQFNKPDLLRKIAAADRDDGAVRRLFIAMGSPGSNH